jgi:hypothetical protein
VRKLINEGELDVDTALLALLDSKLAFESADQIVPKSLLAQVRAILTLPRRPQKRQIEVETLIQRTGKPGFEVRDILGSLENGNWSSESRGEFSPVQVTNDVGTNYPCSLIIEIFLSRILS